MIFVEISVGLLAFAVVIAAGATALLWVLRETLAALDRREARIRRGIVRERRRRF